MTVVNVKTSTILCASYETTSTKYSNDNALGLESNFWDEEY